MVCKKGKDGVVLQANIKIEWGRGCLLNHSARWRVVDTDAARSQRMAATGFCERGADLNVLRHRGV